MSNTSKDYFTEMVKLLSGMGIVAIVFVFVMRFIFGGTPSNINSADEKAVNERLKSVAVVSLVGAPAAAKPAEVAKPEAAKAEPAKKEAVADSPAESSAPAEGAKSAEGSTSTASAGDGEALYKAKCLSCHATGVAGAPIFGNKEQWAPRIAKGMDALMDTAINGSKVNPAMLPKGGAADLSDTEIKSIVEYMVTSSQ